MDQLTEARRMSSGNGSATLQKAYVMLQLGRANLHLRLSQLYPYVYASIAQAGRIVSSNCVNIEIPYRHIVDE